MITPLVFPQYVVLFNSNYFVGFFRQTVLLFTSAASLYYSLVREFYIFCEFIYYTKLEMCYCDNKICVLTSLTRRTIHEFDRFKCTKKTCHKSDFFVMFHYSSNFCFAVERLFDDGLRSQGVNYHLKSRRKCPLIKNDKKLFLNKIVMFPPTTNRYYMCPKALIIRQISSKNGNRYLLTLSFRNLIIMLAY